MQAQTVQIRVSLPFQLQRLLQVKTNKFGLNLSSYIRNLIINDVRDVEYPEFEMSSQAIADLKEAEREMLSGKLDKVEDVGQFLNSL